MIDKCPYLLVQPPAKARAFAVLFLGIFMIFGCAAPRGKGPAKEPPQSYWPAPPDPPRIAFEGTFRSAAGLEQESEESAFQRLMTGDQNSVAPAFAKPGGLASHKGRLLVVDTVSRAVVVFDVPRKKVFRFGLRAPNQLQKPTDIAVDGEGRIYVADAKLKTVMVFDELGLFLRTIGQPGDLDRPVGIAVSRAGDRIYVVDRGTVENDKHQVVVYNEQGSKLRTIGPRGSEPGRFNIPLGAAVANDGTLYVLDSGNFRVQSFTPEGEFIRAFGEVGNALGQLARPRGIALDSDGNVYVTDAMFGNFQIFSPAGELLLNVGKLKREDGRAHFALPAGITVDEANRIYVADQLFNKVEIFRRLSDTESESIAALEAAKTK